MKSVRILAPVVMLILLSMVVSMLSCGGGATGSSLEGTWTLTTTPDEDTAFGNGSYTLALIESSTELKMDFYSGEGMIEDVPHVFRVQIKYELDVDGNKYYLIINKEGEDPLEHRIKCYSSDYTSSAASGQYKGEGTYSIYGTGTFNTLKQAETSE